MHEQERLSGLLGFSDSQGSGRGHWKLPSQEAKLWKIQRKSVLTSLCSLLLSMPACTHTRTHIPWGCQGTRGVVLESESHSKAKEMYWCGEGSEGPLPTGMADSPCTLKMLPWFVDFSIVQALQHCGLVVSHWQANTQSCAVYIYCTI